MLKCPSCGSVSFVSTGAGQEKIPGAPSVDTRNTDQTPYIRRRRRCSKCKHLFSTREYEVKELKSIFREKIGKANQPELKTEELEEILQDLKEWVNQLHNDDS